MQANYALKDMTIAELETQLRINEEEHTARTADDRRANYHSYIATKNTLELAIIDKLTGPLKRRVFAAIEPHSNRISKSEWVKFQTDLTGLRSMAAVKGFYSQWRQVLSFRKIADLQELDQPKPMNNRYDHAA